MKRIGVLTGGGDCPGLNAVIRSVSKPLLLKHGYEIFGFKDGYEGLVENKYTKLDTIDVSGILTLGGTILGTSNTADPFHFEIKKNVFKNLSKQVLGNIKKNNIESVVCIGGDGSLSIAYKLFKIGIPIIGIPKTIDNDLFATDRTFGFDTAITTATDAIDKLHTTAQSHHRVMVIELMGRYAGWIALEAGIAGGGDIILIPEIPFDINKVCEVVKNRNRRGKRFSIVVVAEGAKEKGGKLIVDKIIKKSPDPIRLGGIGKVLAEKIEKKTGLETRVTVLGHLQRGGSPTAFDRILATQYGTKAAELVIAKKYGQMVCLKGSEVSYVPLKTAISKLRNIPKNHPLIKSAIDVGTSFGI